MTCLAQLARKRKQIEWAHHHDCPRGKMLPARRCNIFGEINVAILGSPSPLSPPHLQVPTHLLDLDCALFP